MDLPEPLPTVRQLNGKYFGKRMEGQKRFRVNRNSAVFLVAGLDEVLLHLSSEIYIQLTAPHRCEFYILAGTMLLWE